MKKEVFLPPGVQARLIEKTGSVPRKLDEKTVAEIDVLWDRRNSASESDLAAIDEAMERLVLRRGRPPGTTGEAMSAVVRVRCDFSEKGRWTRAARQKAKTLSEWIRQLANESAGQE